MAVFKLSDLGEKILSQYDEELKRQLLRVNQALFSGPPAPPIPRWRMLFYRFRSSLLRARRWLGEIVAGRKFD